MRGWNSGAGQVESAVTAGEVLRASQVASYLPTVTAISHMVAMLAELRGELDDEDYLQDVLATLSFCWLTVEAELIAAAAPGGN